MPAWMRQSVLALLLLGSPAVAVAADDGGLEARIADRIEAETECRVDYISQLRDLRDATPPRVEARVHCRDGEAYDVDWQLSPDRFRFEPCAQERAVCQGSR